MKLFKTRKINRGKLSKQVKMRLLSASNCVNTTAKLHSMKPHKLPTFSEEFEISKKPIA